MEICTSGRGGGGDFGSGAGGPGWVGGLGEHTRTRLSGSGLWPWGLVKTILSGWPEACCMHLGVQKVLDGQQQQGDGSDSSGLLRLGWLWWWPSGTNCTRETWFKFYLVGNATDLT